MKTKLLSLTHLLLIQLILAFSPAQAQKLVYFVGGWGTDSNQQIRSFNEEQALDGLSDFTAQFSYRTNVDRWLVFNSVDASNYDLLNLDFRYANTSLKDCADIFLLASTNYSGDVATATWTELYQLDLDATVYSGILVHGTKEFIDIPANLGANTTFAVHVKMKDPEPTEASYFRLFDLSIKGSYSKAYVEAIAANSANLRTWTPIQGSGGVPLSEQKDYQKGLCLRAVLDGVSNPVERHYLVPLQPGVDASIFFAEWAIMQPDPFGPIVTDAIDAALEEIRTWNANNPDQISMRLRVFGGVHSPNWLMNYAGKFETNWANGTGVDIKPCPFIWTDQHRLAWEDFMIKLAEIYDDEPLVRCITVAGQGTNHTEVTHRRIGFVSFTDMVAAGLTYERDVELWKRDISFMLETWQKTPLEMTFNWIQSYQVSNGVVVDGSLTPQPSMIDELIALFRTESARLNNKRYTIGNHTLSYEQNLLDDRHYQPNTLHGKLVTESQANNVDLYWQTQTWQAEYTDPILAVAAEVGSSLVELTQGMTVEQILSESAQASRAIMKGITGVDEVSSITGPTELLQGETVTVNVSYSATTTRDIKVYLQENGVDINGDSNLYSALGDARFTVNAGEGIATIELTANVDAPISSDYRYTTFLTTEGGGWAERIGSDMAMDGVSVTAPLSTPTFDPGVDFDLNGYVNNRLDAGETTVVVPPGRYRVAHFSNTHLNFSNRNNVTIIADGVEMICTETVQAVQIQDCNNLKLKGLTVDYDPLPFTQGEIVAMSGDKSTLTVDLIDGYPNHLKSATDKIEIFDPVSGELVTTTSYNATSTLNTTTRTVTITKPANSNYWEELGDIVVFGSKNTKNIPHGIVMNRCSNLVLENVILYAGTMFGFFETNCNASRYINCKVDRRPPETDIKERGTRRMRSITADGFHSKHAAVGPSYVGCVSRYNGDDGIAINGDFHVITASNGNQLTIVGKAGKTPNLAVGDSVELVSYNGERLPNAQIVTIEAGRTLTTQEIQFLQSQTFYAEAGNTYKAPSVYYVTLSRSVDLPMGSLIASANRIGNGFEVRDCIIGPNRSRGILVKASNGIISGNTLTDNWGQAIKLAPEYVWLEAGSGSNVIVSDNVISGCHDASIAVYAYGGNGSTAPVGAHNNIQITGNSISRSSNPAIAVTSTSKLILKDNTIESPNNDLLVPWIMNNFGRNEDPSREIYLKNVELVEDSVSTSIKSTEARINLISNIYPNPVTGNFLNVKLNTRDSVKKIEIFDAMGKLMYLQEKFIETEINIDVSRFRTGMYFLKVQNNGKIDCRKIIMD